MRLIRLMGLLGAITLLAPSVGTQTFLKKRLNEWRDDLKKTDSPQHRRSAAFALGQIGPVASVAIDELIDRVQNDKDAGVREMAARAVGDIVLGVRPTRKPEREWTAAGKALDAALKDPDPRVRRSAAYALGAFGDLAATSLPSLREAFRDKAPTVRQNAAWAIGKMGDPGDETVRELCTLLGDESPVVRRLTAGALSDVTAKQKKKSPEPALALLKMLKNERDDVVCRIGLGALATMTDESLQKHAGDIYPLLASKDAETARATAFVLANMGGEPAARAIAPLRKALADPDPNIQTIAAACLANAGAAAAPAVESLAQTLDRSKNPDVRQNCVVALGLIHKAMNRDRDRRLETTAPIAVAALMDAMKIKVEFKDDVVIARSKEQIREDAAEALGSIRYPLNKKAFPLLAELLRKDENQALRQHCVWALFRCTDIDSYDDLKKALVSILEEKGDASLIVRYDTARYLALVLKEKAPDRVTDILLDMLTNNKIKVSFGSGTTVDGIGDEGKRGGARVTTRIGGDGRFMAAEALGWMAPKLKGNDKVTKALEAAAKDADTELSKKAAETLEAIKK